MYVITVPLQGLILSAYAKVRGSSMVKADDRLKVTNETLQGIKVVKLFGWEDIFLNKIKDTRKEQVKELRKGVFFGGLLIPAGTLGGTLANIVALGLYSVFNNGTPLTPDVAFPALILLSGIIGQIVTLPPALKLCVNGNISIRRLEKFLSAPEIENDVQGRDNFASVMKLSRAQREAVSSFESEPLLEPQYGTFQYTPLPEEELVEIGQKQREEESLAASIAGDVAIEIKDGTFSWNTEHGTPTLLEVNLQIPAGKLTMIIGEVGSGKSSLISAMLGEMQILRGEVIWNKKMNSAAFADQRAWLQNATLKQNVIFGNYEGEKRYNDVITCCALAPDIAILPAGDETEIGEKGINLSGGQKQRINVGRALYSKSDVVILDDPLSALDSHVGAQVFQDGIKLWLGGENRTVILVTHQLKYIEKADNIIVMKDGTILTQGSPAQIKKSDPTLWSLWQGMINAEVNEEEEQQQEAEQKKTEERVRLIRQISEHAKEERYRRLSSVSSVEGLEDVPVSDLAELTSKALEEEDNPNRGRLIQMEERQTGSIPWKTYFNFLAKAGVFSVALTIITNVVVLFTGVFGQYWISLWSQSGQDAIDEGDLSSYSNGFYTGFYSLISFTALFANLVGGLSVYWSVLTAGVKFHDNSITSVLRSPLRFFDTTPSGRIMNRFSADLDKIDQELGLQISIFIMTFLYVVGGVLVNALVAQFFFVLLLPFFFFFLYVTQYYLTSTREMKRLESISLSPVYNHFSETLSGLPTIRAYGYQAQFSEESFRRIDRSALVGLFRTMSNVWLTIQLALLSNLLFMVIGILLLILSKGGAILAGSVGLALSSMLNACTQFSTIVSNAAEIEMSMNAVERLDYYDDLPSEEYDGIVDPPSIWPDQGEIVLDRIWVRYDQDLDPVLKNVSLTFKPEEKIGICGRTGSGKSSMTLSLFKIIDIFSGYIYIDGMNIKHIPLTKLRRKLSIVPQDPVLFNGSIRFNLDPLSEMTDEKLWEAIEIAQLKNVVAKLNGGLDAEVSEGGENFSVGQRQLFCLARAFLRDTKILIMDEATASIDMETDAILQKIVATAFHKRTVLTIAHRTATILDSDRVIVLDNGRVAENDTPGRLLQRDSIFASLVNQNK
ncbi:putative ATP-binding cassette sub-family C member 9-like [Apostichopus japonicus]|uniref:Putative ATP-binding cassette sub-family C member 9-like n=1 Tax=Stichopus japonicus TaxID=307972 RepID=A0A2G8KZR9_STIJA|nr:putative ATP-binding cassette sub-family C member 9-like [Apostichopus japonicus]